MPKSGSTLMWRVDRQWFGGEISYKRRRPAVLPDILAMLAKWQAG